MSMNEIKVDPKFAYRVWQARKRRDRVLRQPDSNLAVALQRSAIATAAQGVQTVLSLMQEADTLNAAVRQKRRDFEVLRRKAARARKKSLANQYYREASDLYREAEAAATRLDEIEQELRRLNG